MEKKNLLVESFSIGFTPHDPTWAASKTLLIPLCQQRHPRFHGSPAGVKVLMSASQRPPTPPMTNGTFIRPFDGESLGVVYSTTHDWEWFIYIYVYIHHLYIDGESLGVDGIVLHFQ